MLMKILMFVYILVSMADTVIMTQTCVLINVQMIQIIMEILILENVYFSAHKALMEKMIPGCANHNVLTNLLLII